MRLEWEIIISGFHVILLWNGIIRPFWGVGYPLLNSVNSVLDAMVVYF